jgi:hypothetical protein
LRNEGFEKYFALMILGLRGLENSWNDDLTLERLGKNSEAMKKVFRALELI